MTSRRAQASFALVCALACAVAHADPADDDAASSRLPPGVETGGVTHRQILFTFDDGPDTRLTRDLLGRLARRHVHAVFFLVSKKIEAGSGAAVERAAIARETLTAGHVIASHGYEHVRLDRLPAPALAAMLDRDDAIHERVLGRRPRLFRPPNGMASAALVSLAHAHGRVVLDWSLNTRDYSEHDPARVLHNFVAQLAYREREHGERGGVVLLHDTHAWSLDAFERIHDWLRAQNCALLGTSEELWDVVDDPGYVVPEAAVGPLEALADRQSRLRAETRARCVTH